MRTFHKLILVIPIIGLLLTPLISFPNDKPSMTHEDEMNQSRQLNEQALKLFKQGKTQEAISIWEKASKIAVDPHARLTSNAEVLNNLGFAYYKLGRTYYPKAIENLQSALAIDPNRWTIYLNLGDLYKEIDQRALSIENYKKVLELNPKYKYANKLKAEITEFSSKYVKKMKEKEPLPTAPPSSSTTVGKVENLTAYEYFFRIHPNLPEYKFVLYLDKEKLPRYIDVLRPDEDNAFQVLAVNDGEDINYHCEEFYGGGQGRLEVMDINFDGYQDLKLECFFGQHNKGYLFWLYDKVSSKFIFNSELSELLNPVPNTKTMTITSDVDQGCAGTCRNFSAYKFIGNKLVLLDSYEYTLEEDGSIKKKGKNADSQ